MKKYIIALFCALHVPLFAMEARDVAELIKNHKPPVCIPGKVICSRSKEEPTIAVDFATAIVNEDVEQVKCLADFCTAMPDTYSPKELQAAALLAIQTDKVNSLKALFDRGVRLEEHTQTKALYSFYGLAMARGTRACFTEPLFDTLNSTHPFLLTHFGSAEGCLALRNLKDRTEKYKTMIKVSYRFENIGGPPTDFSYLRATTSFLSRIITLHAQQMAEQARKKQETEQAH